MAGWLADGSLQRKFHIVDGLENAPHALSMLFNGGNTGKLCVLSLCFVGGCIAHEQLRLVKVADLPAEKAKL
jgi:hypothetical protein